MHAVAKEYHQIHEGKYLGVKDDIDENFRRHETLLMIKMN